MICKEKDCTRMVRTICDRSKPSVKVPRVSNATDTPRSKFTWVFPRNECASGLCEDCYKAKERKLLEEKERQNDSNRSIAFNNPAIIYSRNNN